MSSSVKKHPAGEEASYSKAQYPQEPALVDASVYTDPDRYER